MHTKVQAMPTKTAEELAMPMLAALIAKNEAARAKRIRALVMVHQKQRDIEANLTPPPR